MIKVSILKGVEVAGKKSVKAVEEVKLHSPVHSVFEVFIVWLDIIIEEWALTHTGQVLVRPIDLLSICGHSEVAVDQTIGRHQAVTRLFFLCRLGLRVSWAGH